MIELIELIHNLISEDQVFLEQAGKAEALEEEVAKKAVLESYLPQTLDEESTKKLIESTVSKLGITDLKTGRGLLMKELMAEHKSELDGALVNAIINSML